MIEDMCKFFTEIEADPTAIISGMTVRDYLLAQQHLYSCDSCYIKAQRVNARYQAVKNDLPDYLSEN